MIKNQNIYYILILTIFSLCLTIFYGHKGVWPIDSFIIFNGGYNIINGFHPFKDYWSITGPLLDYLQYLFFLIGKLNWFSYVMHAAFINVMLCLFSFYFFFFFFLYNKYWFLSSCILIFSFFSKQIPSSYFLIFIILFLIIYFVLFKNYFKNILYFLYGGILVSLLFCILLFLNEIPFKNFYVQYILYPMTLGAERSELLNLNLKNTIFQFKFIFLGIAPFILSSIFLIKTEKNKEKKYEEIMILFIIMAFLLIFIYAQLMTQNQILIFFIIPFFISMSHLYVAKLKKNKIILLLLISVFLFSTIKYHFRFNVEKKFMELSDTSINLAVDAKQLDDKLSGLKWITPLPRWKKNPQGEINILIDTKNYLLKEKEKYILITDYQILPALINLENVSPNKWYDRNSVPKKNNIYSKDYVSFLKKSIEKQNIKHIYIINSDKKFIEDLYSFKDCMNYEQINLITQKVSIDNCRN